VHSPVKLRVDVEGRAAPAEPGAVTVAWRAGIDLNPLDVTNPDDVRWLQTLVWPEQHERLQRLNTAIALAQADPPRIVRGDLNARLGEVAAQAPSYATLVVFHTAVLDYVLIRIEPRSWSRSNSSTPIWIAQEGLGVLPGVAARLRQQPRRTPADTVVALDHHPVAFSALHGGWLRWLDAPHRRP